MIKAADVLGLAVLGLLGLAVVMVPSAGMTVQAEAVAPLEVLWSRHAVYAGLALVAFWVGSRLDAGRWLTREAWGNPVLIAFAVALVAAGLVLVPGMGTTVNGATRWLRVGAGPLSVSIQPSELVKWTLPAALVWWCVHQRRVLGRFRQGFVPAVAMLAVGCGLVVLEDLGTAVLIAAVAALVLLAGGVRLWHLATLVPPAVAVAAAAILSSPYRLARLTAFLDPWADAQGRGYHPIQSMLAIAEGGLSGRGLGNGIQKFGYLPEDTTDYLFAVICEELGLIGVLVVLGLYAAVMAGSLSVAHRRRDAAGRLLVLGVLATLGLQAAMNLAVVSVLAPAKGIALPLLSAGGSGWVLTAFALGLVAGLERDGEPLALAEAESPSAVTNEAEDRGLEADRDGSGRGEAEPTSAPSAADRAALL